VFGFGKKVVLEIPDGKGGVKKVRVSRKQYDQWVAEGAVEGLPVAVAHIIDPMTPPREERWVVGEEIAEETYNRFKNKDGDIFVMIHYEKGEPQTSIIMEEMWIDAKRMMDSI